MSERDPTADLVDENDVVGAEVFAEFDKRIEDLLATTDWTKATKEHAVELFEYLHIVRRYRIWLAKNEDHPYTKIALPIRFEALILEAARAGMRKGTDRKGVFRNYMDKWQIGAVIEVARRHKAELIKTGMKATGHNSAEAQAIGLAIVALHKRYGMKEYRYSTIKTWMNARHDFWSRPKVGDLKK